MATVSCKRCGRTAPGLPRAPLAGQLGQDVLANVCADCWKDWQNESFRLINHFGYQPVDPADRQKIYVHLREFCNMPAENN